MSTLHIHTKFYHGSHLLDISVFPHQHWRQECSRGSRWGWVIHQTLPSLPSLTLPTRKGLGTKHVHNHAASKSGLNVWTVQSRLWYLSNPIPGRSSCLTDFLNDGMQSVGWHIKYEFISPYTMPLFFLYKLLWKLCLATYQEWAWLDLKVKEWNFGSPTNVGKWC